LVRLPIFATLVSGSRHETVCQIPDADVIDPMWERSGAKHVSVMLATGEAIEAVVLNIIP
jgi:diphthamide synthase (EF-2-diphthine--ammonia ligase)